MADSSVFSLTKDCLTMISRRLIASLIVLMAVGGSAAMGSTVVVLGNLGASGTTGGLSTTNTGITNAFRVAQVFNTGTAVDQQLTSVTLGAFSASGSTLGLSVYNDAGGTPGSLFAQSTNTIQLSTNTNGSLNTWLFSNAAMVPNTNYWIVPTVGMNWSLRSSFTAFPTEQNDSGYSYVGAYESSNSGASWGLVEGGQAAYAVSIQAVPEPSTWAMAAAGAGLVGLIRWRRRAAASARIG
jgi:hypothetical protein